MKGRPREKRENWLLIKAEDAFARTEKDPDILVERPESAKTGRLIEDVAGEEPGWSSKTGRIEKRRSRKGDTDPAPAEAPADPAPEPLLPPSLKGAKKAKLPDFVAPQLATLVAKPPPGAEWVHEIKFDGYRLIARIEKGQARLLTRAGLDWSDRFGPALREALAALPLTSGMLDGEIVVEGGAGASDFSALQADLGDGRSDRFVFYLFDLLFLDGYDLRSLTLLERKALLHRLLAAADPVLRYSEHFGEEGGLVLSHACRLSLEGVVSKRADAPYRSGRGRTWLKSKCSSRQEFVVAGYVPSSVSGRAIGSLVMGVYDGKGALVPVGRVGTGYTAKTAQDLFRRLEPLSSDESPFSGRLDAAARRGVRFVRPELVAEVEFRAWTGEGNIRHAAFRGLREDKDPRSVRRETTERAPMDKEPQRRVTLTHPDRIYWPEQGITKEGLADYYAEVWRYIAPFITGRPLALLRCPEGISGEAFFQKNAWRGMNPHIRLVDDPRTPAQEQLISIDDLDGLMALVQSAALEIHPWGSTVADWEHPDQIVMDLDPDTGLDWTLVLDAAREVRDRLEAAGLKAFVKTSGGKGLHVCAPLKPSADWPAVKAFTKGIAEAMAADSPDRYVATISKAKRKDRILVDYLRNQRGSTAVAPYCPRARPGAPVSMPLGWDELSPAIGPAFFTLPTAPARLAALNDDPWGDFRKAAVALKTG
jgi:bifunctional non-homologous end joining protein LigD